MDRLVQTLGITSLSKSQVSRMAADLDEQVTAFLTRPLDDVGPFAFVAADALTMKVRDHGRVVNAVVVHPVQPRLLGFCCRFAREVDVESSHDTQPPHTRRARGATITMACASYPSRATPRCGP